MQWWFYNSPTLIKEVYLLILCNLFMHDCYLNLSSFHGLIGWVYMKMFPLSLSDSLMCQNNNYHHYDWGNRSAWATKIYDSFYLSLCPVFYQNQVHAMILLNLIWSQMTLSYNTNLLLVPNQCAGNAHVRFPSVKISRSSLSIWQFVSL